MNFGEKVIALCTKKGVSKSKMADAIGISRSTPKEWVNGAQPQNATVKKVAEYFDVSVESLLSDESTDESVTVHTVNDNHGIIGSTHAPVTIINGSERKLSEEEITLLGLFEKLSVMDKAKLLVYAEELQK